MKALQDASHEDCMVYTHLNEFFDMLKNKNSFVRTRGLVLIAENAIWDEKGIIDRFFESYLQHITDEKPITARQCIKLLPTIAKHKPELIKRMTETLDVYKRQSLEPLGRDVLTGLIKTAENTITGAGYEFGIYTGQFFYDGGFFDAGAFDCPMWVARYPVSRSFVFDENPPSDKYRPEIKQQLFAWKHTSKGRLDGIDSLVDLDICYLPFG